MNIHEYQAKALLKTYGAPIAEGVVIFSADEAKLSVEKLPGPLYVVKSQIHAAGRGKGKFKELGPHSKGGVRLETSVDAVIADVHEMLGSTLVTKQTGASGSKVTCLYIENGANIDRELYLSLFVDRSAGQVSFFASTQGGMDIEEVAKDTPEKIVKVLIDPLEGITSKDISRLCDSLELEGNTRVDSENFFLFFTKLFLRKI